MDGLKPGMRGEASLVVGTNDTAPRIGSGRVGVLGTPVMITLMEEAALACVEHALPEGCQSLGTHLDVSHLAATPTGMRITAEAELVEVDGRKLTFAVRARDEAETIGEGTHRRVVVELAPLRGPASAQNAGALSGRVLRAAPRRLFSDDPDKDDDA